MRTENAARIELLALRSNSSGLHGSGRRDSPTADVASATERRRPISGRQRIQSPHHLANGAASLPAPASNGIATTKQLLSPSVLAFICGDSGEKSSSTSQKTLWCLCALYHLTGPHRLPPCATVQRSPSRAVRYHRRGRLGNVRASRVQHDARPKANNGWLPRLASANRPCGKRSPPIIGAAQFAGFATASQRRDASLAQAGLLAFKLLPHGLQLLLALGRDLGESQVEPFQRLKNDVRDQ